MACIPFPAILETASNLKSETGLRRWRVLSMPWPSDLALLSTGRVSGNTHTSRATSRRARVRANSAGYWKAANVSPTPTLLPHREKAAPMVGPSRKPIEKAMAITACKEKGIEIELRFGNVHVGRASLTLPTVQLQRMFVLYQCAFTSYAIPDVPMCTTQWLHIVIGH